MSHWDSQVTVQMVHRLFGYEQRNRAEPPLLGLVDRLNWAAFHLYEIDRIYTLLKDEVIRDHGPSIVLGQPSRQHRERFSLDQTALAAHTMAAAHSLHAVADIAAHALYFSLAIDQNTRFRISDESLPIAQQVRISFDRVVKAVKVSEPHAALRSIKKGDDWHYLDGVVSLSKHQRVIRSGITFELGASSEEAHRLKFQSFAWKGKNLPSRDAIELLRAEQLRIHVAVHRIVNSIHDTLA